MNEQHMKRASFLVGCAIVATLALALGAVQCGGHSPTDPSDEPDAPTPPNMAGDWGLSVVPVSPFCPDTNADDRFDADFSVTQSGATISWEGRVPDEGDFTAQGTIDLDGSFRLSGTFTEDPRLGGDTEPIEFDGMLSDNGQSMSGTLTSEEAGCVQPHTFTATRR